MNRDLTQHGFSFLLCITTTIITLTLMGMYIHDFYDKNFASGFSTTYLMIATGFVSFVMIFLTLSIANKESYEKAKPMFHRIFIAIGIVLLISTIIGATSPINTPTYSYVGIVGSLAFFFLHSFGYSLIIDIDRKTGEIDKYFMKTKILWKRKKK